jgi:hypothetical protein
MKTITIPGLPNHIDSRLTDRYEDLVLGHLHPLQSIAAGISILPDTAEPFAATQAA